jgi:hypothetical protein
VAQVRLRVFDVDATGRVCHVWFGKARRVTITAAEHHAKVTAPSTTLTSRCGQALEAGLEIRHRSGNPVEVEPTLGLPGGAVRVQTHLWLTRP